MEASEKLADEYLKMVRGTPKDRRIAFIAGYNKCKELMEADTKVKNLVKPDVMRSFTIRKIRLGKCSFEKRRFGVSVIDLTEIGTDLHMIAIQLFFKTGLAIFYKLIEDEK